MSATDEARRLKLYAYLDAREHRRTYLAIMRLFASTLLADLSAGEVTAALARAERLGEIPPGEARVETVIVRLKQLVEWGNLVAGRREVVAASIAEFQHGSVRYQVSKLGVRVQRAADELLATAEGAREVSRELLPAIVNGLDELLRRLRLAGTEQGGRRATERLAEQVTTLFLQHGELAATVRDFYAYLGQVVTRYHLMAEEISGFRNLLVEYIQKVVEDVLRYTPTIAEILTRHEFAGAVTELLRILTPESLGADIERARGRRAEDWVELTDWFVDRPGRPSQVTALREATARAIGTLLATVKRATSGGGPEPGRRAELLTLAKWFDESTPDQAHTLAAAAFGLYSARNLLPAPEHDGGDDERTPWADGPVIDVTVSVRGRGDRGARGRTSRILDDPLGREQLLAQARHADARHADALAELAAARGRLDRVTLSPDALGTLCGLLTDAMAQRERTTDPGEAGDPVGGLRLTVRPEPGHTQTIHTTAGTLHLADTTVEVSAR
ncbi:TIGR02677 family protein [Actinophytocola xinjiangensis]|uniref:TIGR02677 family protein n=1 Tax=Actinophytocola xinjiangensis TaxID=485602 RepID=A0A7Z1AUV0_9PSEU|nr:TIGR02677 family protein [Actinophytocola xinjiangensis]OLF05563.1 TIGR02677 family protein [Actinophytocola xinjiangensis]